VILKPPPGSSMRCSLRVRPVPSGIACVVFDDEENASEDDPQLGRTPPNQPWRRWARAIRTSPRAILGPHPNAPEWRHPAPLAEPTVIGPVLLTPGGVQMREMAGYVGGRIERPWPAGYTWLVIASGTVQPTVGNSPSSWLVWPMRKACRELIGNLLRGVPDEEAQSTTAGAS
jgi:hypothetical protein